MSQLSETDATARLYALRGWTRANNEIVKTFELPDFPSAVMFVAAVGQLAQTADHHPDIDIRYRKVTLTLSTHSAGGLTAKDFDLAEKIEALVTRG
jgi:4a-hydroxytetrahydrobiopterin dehydratase